jgi:hypothetical protein
MRLSVTQTLVIECFRIFLSLSSESQDRLSPLVSLICLNLCSSQFTQLWGAVRTVKLLSALYTLRSTERFYVWRHIWRKNWVNCAVLRGNSAGLGTVLASRLLHRELRISLRESHSFLSFPADTTMASSQGTSFSSNSFSRWSIAWYIPFQIPLLIPHLTLSFRITLWPIWLANSKRQPCFYPP